MNRVDVREATELSTADVDLAVLVGDGTNLDRHTAELLAARLKAAGEPTRLCILSMLAHGPDEGLTVSDCTGVLGLTQPTVSHHFRILRESGLVERTKSGVWAFYTLRTQAVEELGMVFTNVVGNQPQRTARKRRLKVRAERVD